MNIGIFGAGNVGGTLGCAWAKGGHQITFGVPDASDPRVRALLAQIGGGARAGSVAEAARADVLALTVPWEAVPSVLAGAGDLSGKVLLDCTNPLQGNQLTAPAQVQNSGGEQVAAWALGAKVVKTFNILGFEGLADPHFGGEAATMLCAGDDDEAKNVAATLAREMGFDWVDAGPLASARLLESLAVLWGQLAYGGMMGRGIAFRLLRREPPGA